MNDQAMQHQTWWQKNKQRLIASVIMLVLLLVFALAVIRFSWDWTGFGPYDPKTHAKTFWDWLNLLGVLAVPVVVLPEPQP